MSAKKAPDYSGVPAGFLRELERITEPTTAALNVVRRVLDDAFEADMGISRDECFNLSETLKIVTENMERRTRDMYRKRREALRAAGHDIPSELPERPRSIIVEEEDDG